jgi:hypothetical protein
MIRVNESSLGRTPAPPSKEEVERQHKLAAALAWQNFDDHVARRRRALENEYGPRFGEGGVKQS